MIKGLLTSIVLIGLRAGMLLGLGSDEPVSATEEYVNLAIAQVDTFPVGQDPFHAP